MLTQEDDTMMHQFLTYLRIAQPVDLLVMLLR
jgi:hypothetical protein